MADKNSKKRIVIGDPFALESKGNLAKKIVQAPDYDELFRLVKRTVEHETGRHRAGLSLVLSDLPNAVGAYHPVGSNVIVLNRSLVEDMRRFIKKDEVNSFIFTVLMHEYLHSLGLYDETSVRQTVRKICQQGLGESHITVRMAVGNWFDMYPELAAGRKRPARNFEIVQKFDSGSATYLG